MPRPWVGHLGWGLGRRPPPRSTLETHCPRGLGSSLHARPSKRASVPPTPAADPPRPTRPAAPGQAPRRALPEGTLGAEGHAEAGGGTAPAATVQRRGLSPGAPFTPTLHGLGTWARRRGEHTWPDPRDAGARPQWRPAALARALAAWRPLRQDTPSVPGAKTTTQAAQSLGITGPAARISPPPAPPARRKCPEGWLPKCQLATLPSPAP